MIYTQHHDYIVLIGLHGLHPYASSGVMKQAGRKQVIPSVTNMDAHQVDYKDNRIPNVNELPKIWGKKTYLDKKSIESNRY